MPFESYEKVPLFRMMVGMSRETETETSTTETSSTAETMYSNTDDAVRQKGEKFVVVRSARQMASNKKSRL